LVQAEISRLLERYRDRLGNWGPGFLLTVTRAEVKRNLESATVFYSWTAGRGPASAGPSTEEVARTLEALIPDLTRELSGRVRFKRMPRIDFRFDPNLAAGDRVYSILENLELERREPQAPRRRVKRREP